MAKGLTIRGKRLKEREQESLGYRHVNGYMRLGMKYEDLSTTC